MTSQIDALQTIFTEFYYWITVVLMFLIHVGFCMYEVGASRYKHHQHTLMKNTMLIPLVTVTWFLFGWWIYWAFPTGPGLAPSIMTESTGLVLGGDASSTPSMPLAVSAKSGDTPLTVMSAIAKRS